MLLQEIFEMKLLRLAKNEFHTTKLPDFSCFLKNSDFFALH